MTQISDTAGMQAAMKRKAAVVLYGKPGCLHCTVVRKCAESVEDDHKDVGFFFTEDKGLAAEMNVTAFPTLIFFGHGMELGRMIGSTYATKLREVMDLMEKTVLSN